MSKKKTLKEIASQPQQIDGATPYMIESVASSSITTRRNLAGTIERSDRFKNIDEGFVPFRNSGTYGTNKSTLDCRDPIILCQKCYYNFATFANIIDLMTEFSVNNIFFKGGNKKAKAFFEALFEKINLWDLQDKFFREYYRSGNVFVYRYDSKVTAADIARITSVYAAENELQVETLVLPSRYI